MAKQTINIGTTANDGTGDTLREGMNKVNDNFTEIWGGPGSSQAFSVGVLSATGLTVSKPGTASASINSTDTTTTSYSRLALQQADGTGTYLDSYCSAFTQNGAYRPSGGQVSASGSGGLSITATDPAGDVRIYAGGYADANLGMTVAADGTVSVVENIDAARAGFGEQPTYFTAPVLQARNMSGRAESAIFCTNDYLTGSTGSRLNLGFGATSGNTYASIAAMSNGGNAWAPLVLNYAGGNVLIGLLTSTYKLHIKGGNTKTLAIDNDGSQYTSVDIKNNGTTKVVQYWDNINAQFSFFTASGEPLLFQPGNGNILVGTSTNDGVNKLQVAGSIKSGQYRISALNTTPSSATDTGTLGEIRITATYIYVCVATNTWVRSALTTW